MNDYHPKTDEEFYKIIKKREEEVDSLNIPKSEKDKLYSLIEETVKRHETQKENRIEYETTGKKLEKALSDYGKFVINIYKRGEEARNKVNQLYKKAIETKVNIIKTSENLNVIKENVYKIEKNIKNNIKNKESNDFFEELRNQSKIPKV